MEKSTKKVSILNIPIYPFGVGNVTTLLSQKSPNQSLITTFVNPHACYLDSTIPGYADMLQAFDVVACDGIGMVKAAQASGLGEIQRESFDFSSLAGDVLQAAVDLGWTVGLVGGKPGVSENAASNLREKFPGLEIAGCFSGYAGAPLEAQRLFAGQQVDLVICGMGAPLQEKFLLELVAMGWHGAGFTCGGFLDQTVNWQGSYPDWIDRHDLRFLYRLVKEPRRLWRRYLVEYQVFLRRYCHLQWKRVISANGDGSAADKMK